METKPVALRQPTNYWITLGSNQVIYVSFEIMIILKLSSTPAELGFCHCHFKQLMSIAAAVFSFCAVMDKLLTNQLSAHCPVQSVCLPSRVRMLDIKAFC